MLELPEVVTLKKDLKNIIIGKKVIKCIANKDEHKFAWFFGDYNKYHEKINQRIVTDVKEFGFYVQIEFDEVKLLFRDGTNLRYHKDSTTLPKKHQLLIEFEDETFLTVTIAMYGGIWCFKNNEFNDNVYYNLAINSVSPISNEFDEKYFNKLLNNAKETISAKAFLATQQRICGIGNGVCQDLLFNAKIHPKKKINTFSDENKKDLFYSIKETLKIMCEKGGRDTEKNLFNQNGGYKTILSKNTVGKECLVCGDGIKKESFLGGSIYYCSTCQRL